MLLLFILFSFLELNETSMLLLISTDPIFNIAWNIKTYPRSSNIGTLPSFCILI